MRPRFVFQTTCPHAAVLDRLRARLKAPDAPCTGATYPNHALLKIHAAEQHFWSPQLSLDFEPLPDGTTRVRGLFGPHPSVWTLFMATYAVLAFAGLGALLYGYATWSLGQGAAALWGAPVALALGGLVYLLALVGQHLGYDQMEMQRRFIEDALEADPTCERTVLADYRAAESPPVAA
jgi:hypothetical protein